MGSSTSASRPAYSGGFYSKGPDGKGVIGIAVPDVGLDPNEGDRGAGGADDGDATSSGDAGASDPNAAAQSGPDPSVATVPGPGIAIVLVLVSALVLAIARRRLQ